MTVVLDDIPRGKDPGTCGMALGLAMAVAAEVRALLPSLRFNDPVSGEWMLQRDAKNPQVLSMAGRSSPIRASRRRRHRGFRRCPRPPTVRIARADLIVYTDPASGLLTVYNDGAIQDSTHVRAGVCARAPVG